MTFEKFYDLHFKFLDQFALYYLDKTVVEDVVQETFFTAYRKFSKVSKHEYIRGWLIQTAKNHARRTAREAITFERDSLSYFDDYGVTELVTRGVPEIDANLLHAFYVKGCDGKTIAREFNLSPQNVYVRFHRIRAKLRDGLYVQERGSCIGSRQ
jgi:DNA-directed RNA polymerase specialized sigma24 family protein